MTKPKPKSEHKKRGRPAAEFKREYIAQVQHLVKLSATDDEMADFFGVKRATFFRWKAKHPEFRDAINGARPLADERVVNSLYSRAMGYTHDAVKIFPPTKDRPEPVIVEYREHVPPDVVACIFWLKNRQPKLWRDKVNMEHGLDPELSEISDEDRLKMLSLFLARQAKEKGMPLIEHDEEEKVG